MGLCITLHWSTYNYGIIPVRGVGIQYTIVLMVIKGEYMTRDETTWKKGGYVFQDYRLGEFIYHFTNLFVATNLVG
jgi:hypothetical protein